MAAAAGAPGPPPPPAGAYEAQRALDTIEVFQHLPPGWHEVKGPQMQHVLSWRRDDDSFGAAVEDIRMIFHLTTAHNQNVIAKKPEEHEVYALITVARNDQESAQWKDRTGAYEVWGPAGFFPSGDDGHGYGLKEAVEAGYRFWVPGWNVRPIEVVKPHGSDQRMRTTTSSGWWAVRP
jgi:hypothetical protein